MTLRARRLAYFLAVGVVILVSTWDGAYETWRALLGDDVGTAMASFWDLQVESWVTAPLVVGALDLVYGLGRTPDGRWASAYRGRRVHVLWYLGLVLLTLACAAEGPMTDLLQPVLGDQVGASVAHYLRRALEAPVTALGVMVFMDLVRPGGLDLGVRSVAARPREEAATGGPRPGR